MDFISVIYGLGFLAIFTLPIVYIELKKKNQIKNLTQNFHGFAKEHNLTLSEFELIRSKCLGLDSSKKVFIYADFDKNPALKHVIKLQEVQSVSVKESSRKVETSKSESHILDKLELIFKVKSGKTNDVVICLYSTDEAFNMLGELHLANKWVSILKSYL